MALTSILPFCTIQLFLIILVHAGNIKIGNNRTGLQNSKNSNRGPVLHPSLHKSNKSIGQFPRSNRNQHHCFSPLRSKTIRSRHIPRINIHIQLFILLLAINFIYSTGNFLQNLFSHKIIKTEYYIIKAYTIIVNVLFVIVLWRHYQVCLSKHIFIQSQTNSDFNRLPDHCLFPLIFTRILLKVKNFN